MDIFLPVVSKLGMGWKKKKLKEKEDEFEDKYGDRADEVMHATAMTMAKRKYGYT